MTFTLVSLLNSQCRVGVVADVILLGAGRRISLISDFRSSWQSLRGIYYYHCERKDLSSECC